MGAAARRTLVNLGLISSLVMGWLVGFAVHGSAAAASGWGDVPPVTLLLGAILCAWAGVAAWFVAPRRRWRGGAVAGVLMFASFVLGNILIVVLWVDPAHFSEGGESWFSLVLESWFWVGVPLLVSASLGSAGWAAADFVARPHGATAA